MKSIIFILILHNFLFFHFTFSERIFLKNCEKKKLVTMVTDELFESSYINKSQFLKGTTKKISVSSIGIHNGL